MQCCEINRITIVSNIKKENERLKPGICYEQHLSVTAKGMVFFTSYKTSVERLPAHGQERRFRTKEEVANELISRIMRELGEPGERKRTPDDGHWKLFIKYSDGSEKRHTGIMGDGSLYGLSSVVRETLGMPELFMFDGCSSSPEYHFSEHSIKKIVEHADGEKRIINEKKTGTDKWCEVTGQLCSFMELCDEYDEFIIESDAPVSYIVEFDNGTKLQYPRGYGTMDDNIFDILSPYFRDIRIEDGKKQYGQYYI